MSSNLMSRDEAKDAIGIKTFLCLNELEFAIAWPTCERIAKKEAEERHFPAAKGHGLPILSPPKETNP